MDQSIKRILEKKSITADDIEVLRNYEPNDGQNMLYSFFTPIWLCKVMYDLAIRYGFDENNGKILEPASGTGNFLSIFKKPENVTAFELNETNYEIAKKLNPQVDISNHYFEKVFLQPPLYRSELSKGLTWLKQYPFDLVIGNPPYAKFDGLYAIHFKKWKAKRYEIFFMMSAAKLLKKGGLIVFIIPSGFMRNSYAVQKELLSKDLELLDAYRMPDNIFKGTKVPTDIIVLKKI